MHLFFSENSGSFLGFKDRFFRAERRRNCRVKRLKVVKNKIAFIRSLDLFLQRKCRGYNGFEFGAGL